MAQLLKRTVAVEAQKNGMALGFLGKEDGASVAAGITRLRARTAPVTAAMLSSARGRCKAGRNALFTISRYRASLAKRLRHRLARAHARLLVILRLPPACGDTRGQTPGER